MTAWDIISTKENTGYWLPGSSVLALGVTENRVCMYIYIWSITAFIELTFEEQIILPNALKEKKNRVICWKLRGSTLELGGWVGG